MAKGLGLRVTREVLKADITGALVTTPDGPAAVLNSQQPPNRQRLLLAHMIGHLQLGHRFPNIVHVERRFEAYREERRYTPSERVEFEANVFAGTLLMPSRLVSKAVALAQSPARRRRHSAAGGAVRRERAGDDAEVVDESLL